MKEDDIVGIVYIMILLSVILLIGMYKICVIFLLSQHVPQYIINQLTILFILIPPAAIFFLASVGNLKE